MLLVIRGARLFDGLAARPGRPSVFVEDGRIMDVDLTGAEPPTHATVVDLGDVTLLPGLVDAHVHLCFDPATDPVQQMLNGDDATVLDRMRRNARRALRAGITTVRDLGDRDYLALSLRDCDPAGPEPLPGSSPPDRQSPRPEGTAAGSLAGRPTGSRASPARSPSGPNSGSTS